MNKLLLLFILFFISFLPLSSQTTKEIQQLESQRSLLHKKISTSETLLLSTKKDVKSQLSNLVLINGQIQEREKYLNFLHDNIQSLNRDVENLKKDLEQLEKSLKDKKEKYAASVKYMYRTKSIEEKLMFIFSAKNFSQMYRRMRYVREYADYQRVQGREIEARSKQILAKKNEIERTLMTKNNFLKQGQAEKEKLESQHKERQTIINTLNKKQKNIQYEINKNRTEAQKLNSEIDRLISIEIEKARQRALEEARKKAEEAARKAEIAHKAEEERRKTESLKKTTKTKKVVSHKTPSVAPEKKVVTPVEKYNINSADRILTGSFVNNKGKLPMPVTGPYVITGHYGMYNVGGLKNVSLDNKGIDIKARNGAYARSVFNGEVSAVFTYNGLVNVLIRHGEYISVYCNLSSASVAKGSKVTTGQTIGLIHTDESDGAVLHFQLRKETAKLNPEQWLRR